MLAELRAGGFQPVYLLVGADAALADEILSRLKEKALEPGLEAFDSESLNADEIASEDIHQRLRQLPVGARRLVVVRNLTRMGSDGPVFSSLGKQGVAAFCQAVAKTPPATIIAATALKTAELSRLFAEHGLDRFVVDLRPPEAADLVALVRNWARERGLSLTQEAAGLLVDIAGEDTVTLKSEIEKLATCLEPGTTVDPETVRGMAGSSRGFELREYVERFVNRDAGGALAVLRALEASGEEVPRVIGWLTTALLDLVAARAGVLSGYARRRLGPAADRWPDASELNRLVQQLYSIQKSFFEGKPEPYARLELLTHCVGCGTRRGWCELSGDDRHWHFCLRSKPKRNHG